MKVEKGLYQGQEGVWLENDKSRLFIQSFGAMTPEFSIKTNIDHKEQWINTHWRPYFKSPFSGRIDPNNQEQMDYWGGELLRLAGGSFPCAPTFGPGNDQIPPHGDTANSDWRLEGVEEVVINEKSLGSVSWSLGGHYGDLQYRKKDLMSSDSATHYSLFSVQNLNNKALPIHMAFHNTVGVPFIERGCFIETNCQHFTTADHASEFGYTSALKSMQEFDSLDAAPREDGGTSDLSRMPGFNGQSEFISGVTDDKDFLWSVVINPYLHLAYLSAIPLNCRGDQVNPNFMNWWIHSGGRDFKPWADHEGGMDREYALGMEVSVGGSCNGLDWSKENPTLLDKDTFYTLQPHSQVSFICINSIFEVAPDLKANQVSKVVNGFLEKLDCSVVQHISI